VEGVNKSCRWKIPCEKSVLVVYCVIQMSCCHAGVVPDTPVGAIIPVIRTIVSCEITPGFYALNASEE